VKQPVSFRALDDSAHASIEQQIGELAAHHLRRHLQPFSTERVSLRAGVESDTLRTGDAYRVKLRVLPSTTTQAAEEEAEHATAALKTSSGELEQQLERHTSQLLMMDSWRRKARSKTCCPAATKNPKRQRASMNCAVAPAQAAEPVAQRVVARGAAVSRPRRSCAQLEELGAARTTDRSTCRPLDYLVSSAARAQRANKAAPE
jgi:hypothetical protein